WFATFWPPVRSRSGRAPPSRPEAAPCSWVRSEEHTSELQSRFELVCRLLLEKINNGVHVRKQVGQVALAHAVISGRDPVLGDVDRLAIRLQLAQHLTHPRRVRRPPHVSHRHV